MTDKLPYEPPKMTRRVLDNIKTTEVNIHESLGPPPGAPQRGGDVGNDFGWAMCEAQVQGKRIWRTGWNASGQWVCWMPAMIVPEDKVNERTRKFIIDGQLNLGGYFTHYGANRVWQPGWAPSQGDLSARDWQSSAEPVGGANKPVESNSEAQVPPGVT